MRYPMDKLKEEIAFLAYHFHWDYESLLHLEHHDRQQWCDEVSKINQNLNSGESTGSASIENIF